MAKRSRNIVNRETLRVRFRAFCNDDNFVGPWRATKDEAHNDARAHRSVAGNEDHDTDIEIEQRFIVNAGD